MEQDLSYLFSEALRVLFLLGIPVLLLGLISGVIISLFQTGLALHDHGVSYAARALVLLVAGILCMKIIASTLLGFAEKIFLL